MTEKIGRMASVDTEQPVHADIRMIVSSGECDLQRKRQTSCAKITTYFAERTSAWKRQQ